MLIAAAAGAVLLGISALIGVELTKNSGGQGAPPPPTRPVIPPVNVPYDSALQMSLLFMEAQKCTNLGMNSGMHSKEHETIALDISCLHEDTWTCY